MVHRWCGGESARTAEGVGNFGFQQLQSLDPMLAGMVSVSNTPIFVSWQTVTKEERHTAGNPDSHS
jgi:hypothetical protein